MRRTLNFVADHIPALRQCRDERRLRRRMQSALGCKPDLRNPKTFNEKIAWRMLHDFDPLIPLTIDKVNVRSWVAERVGSQVLVPLYGVWECASDVSWQSLPTSFVLKASHGWNMNLLIHDKTVMDQETTMATAATWLRTSHYHSTLEWGYRGLQPRLLAEKLLLDQAGKIPTDLKFGDLTHYQGSACLPFVPAHYDRIVGDMWPD